MLWTELCAFSCSYVEALCMYGGEAFREVIKVKGGHKGGALIQQG